MSVVEYVRMGHVKEGDILARSLYNDKSQILLRAGNKITASGINVIKDLGYKGIYIVNESAERREDIPVPEPLVEDLLCIQIVSFMRDIFQRAGGTDVKKDPMLYTYCKKVEEFVGDLVDMFYGYEKEGRLLFETEDARNYGTWQFYHSLNTCLLAIGMAIKMDLPREQTFNIALGALLHDVGKMFIPRELINKENVTEKEKEEIRDHCTLGFRFFQSLGYGVDMTYGIWFHHEREDGSGYPNGVKGDKIPLAAKIVALASSYDNMINHNPYQPNPLSQTEALERISGDARFDTQCAIALTRFVVPYPVGTKVTLSDGREALVLKNVPGAPLRPYLLCGKELLNMAKDETLLNLVII